LTQDEIKINGKYHQSDETRTTLVYSIDYIPKYVFNIVFFRIFFPSFVFDYMLGCAM